MYYGWVKHGVEPNRFYNMKIGEQMLIKAFYIIESEELEKQKH